jgi:hypothetical protein
VTARQTLNLKEYKAQEVLLPGREDETIKGIRIVVYGEHFPIRALEPEILVGDQKAQRVTVSRDQISILGYLLNEPEEGAVIRVRYGQSQEGVLKEAFTRKKLEPLPDKC